MEKLRKKRSALRTAFTKAANFLENLHLEEQMDLDAMLTARNWLEEKAKQLFSCDEELGEYIYGMEDESAMMAEMDQVESYNFKYFKLISLSDKYLESRRPTNASQDISKAVNNRKYVLPKIELKQFDGEIKNWLGFWGQFHKIDEDASLDDDDKFQYLLQATVPGSSARQLVESFPPSGPNYSKAISMLKSRFARDDLLIELHIRELLKLVLNKESSDGRLRTLYDRLMTQIHALETLKVTKEKYASMLYPMVESTLPEDVLRAWERYRRSDPLSTQPLSGLLAFLEREVASEERIEMAKMGFEVQEPSTSQPTAACIVAGQKDKEKDIKVCIWCSKLSHSSSECIKAREMSLEERKDILKTKRACFKCLRVGHNVSRCKAYVKCIVCQKFHHAILCPDLARKEDTKETAMLCYKNNVTLMPTLLVKITGAKTTKIVRALVDTGSQRSYIRKDIAQELGLKEIGKESFGHYLFGGKETKQEEHKLYDIKINSLSTNIVLPLSVLDQAKICGYVPRLQGSNEVTTILKRNKIELADQGQDNLEVGLLIGSDYIPGLMTGEYVRLNESLVAVKTILGWTIQGRTNGVFQASKSFSVCFSSVSEMDKLWDLETIGIKDPIEVRSQKVKESDAMEFFKNTVKINENNRYEVDLLWKDGRPELESNYGVAFSRLHSTTQRLLLTGNYKEYDNVFKEWLQLGIIEEVVDNVVNGHYLPHHAVVKESSSTTRVRPVFDASAKDSNGISINSCLDKGINLIEKIPKLLTKFREGSVGVLSDIKKAFLQISLSKEDRDYLRFLWWRDFEKKQITTFRHCRVVFGITCSPFLLSSTLLHHLEDPPCELSETALKLSQSFYVDNCISSFANEADAQKFVSESNQLMEAGNFELRGWVVAPTSSNTEEYVSVLGLKWNTQDDTICCNSINVSHKNELHVTKRMILSFAHRIFDPIGFTSPATLIPKILLQKVCQLKLKWDDVVPNDIEAKFRLWLDDINYFEMCRVPRRLSQFDFDKCHLSLHIFCDACKDAYGACIFLRSFYKHEVVLRLVAAKARVAPLKEKKGHGFVLHSIPRLELLACLIGVRLYREFTNTLGVKEVFCWSDSSVALTWIQKDAMWSKFVSNRVNEIREVTEPKFWRHVPGSMNPADLLSRGCSAKSLQELCWWEGPEWLRKPPSDWPVSNFSADCSEVDKELRKAMTCQLSLANSNNFIEENLSYFSKYSKIIRTIAWIFRFIRNCKGVDRISNVELSAEEYSAAELALLRVIQSSYDESLESNLQVFTDEKNLKRVRTRLTYTEEVEDFKSPILLPSKNTIVEKLVRFTHEEMQHAGTRFLVSALRERYWIVGVRRLAKQVVRKCIICKRYTAKPVQPNSAPLPIDRIKNAKAFEVTGVDMAGPLFLKSGEKCWIALFTCAVYRAVHLELCLSLSTDCFLMALRRFIARRGRPAMVYSDNGTNFVGTVSKMTNIDWNKISQFSSVKQIKWRFNVPCAPWWGGWWERLIRVLKELLRRILGKSTLTYDELETILADCEATMNARPLTYVSDDTENLKPLTPACFLQGVSNSEVPDLDTIDHKSLNSRMKYLVRLRQDFRSRFRSEYLGTLINKGGGKQETLKVGDVVLMETDAKRFRWPLGVIIEVIMGNDGHARVAKVKTTDGIRIRPFQKLYPLEVPVRDVPIELRTRSGRLVRLPNRLL